MSDSVFAFLGQLSSLIVLLPLVLSFFFYKRLNRVQKRILLLLVATFISELTAQILWNMQINNNGVFHVYTVIEFVLIVRVFQTVFSQFLPKKILTGIMVFFIIAAILNTIYLQSFQFFNSNTIVTSGIIIILMCLIYFYHLLTKRTYQRLDQSPLFWFSSGLLMYFSTNLALFYIREKNSFNTDNYNLLWGLHSIVNITLILFYTIALWIRPEEK